MSDLSAMIHHFARVGLYYACPPDTGRGFRSAETARRNGGAGNWLDDVRDRYSGAATGGKRG